MFRLFAFFCFFLVNILACEGGYSSCVQKAKDTNAIHSNHLSIPLNNNKHLIYSQKPPQHKLLKSDPFLGLYLIEKKTKAPYVFNIAMPLQLGIGVVQKNKGHEGKILKKQLGITKLAKFSQSYQGLALITNSCCSLEGIATKEGVIQKAYIKHFLLKKPFGYGDIGIRVDDKNREIVVDAIDPFMPNNPLLKGDIVVAFDGKRVRSASIFMQKVLFSKIGSEHKITIKRSGKNTEFVLKVHKRYGGGLISDTFLESQGIYFDKDLRVVHLSKRDNDYGLLLGDRLIEANGFGAKTQKELRAHIQNFEDYASLLFERKSFQFFVNIK